MMLGTNNVGCDFWATGTPNNVWGGPPDQTPNTWNVGLHFGVLLGNLSATVAKVYIDGPRWDGSPWTPLDQPVTLGPREVKTVNLIWVKDLKGNDWQIPWQPASSTQSANVFNGAHHIRSTQPIVAYQFSPVEVNAQTGTNPAACPTIPGSPSGCFSYSTDASLLLPWHALFGSSYVVTGYHAIHQPPYPSAMTSSPVDMGDFLSITVTQAKTTLTVTLPETQTALPWPGDPPFVSGQPIEMTSAGQVIQLVTPGKSAEQTLSGTEILTSGRPIQVLSGVGCASIPLDPTHCSHIEDVVLPKEAFGKEYVVPVLHGPPEDPKPLGHTIRVQAITDGTAITFEPKMMTGVTLGHGEVLEIPNVMADLRISSTVPFGVTQFVNGRASAVPNGIAVGGPSQVTVVPLSQFQTAHSFAASPNFAHNFATIVAPTGASVTVDGKPIMSGQFRAVGSSGMSVAHVDELQGNDTIHTLAADKPVGIVVYGYDKNASYAYPGGLDLKHAAAPR
jgi:hypothetical protein